MTSEKSIPSMVIEFYMVLTVITYIALNYAKYDKDGTIDLLNLKFLGITLIAPLGFMVVLFLGGVVVVILVSLLVYLIKYSIKIFEK